MVTVDDLAKLEVFCSNEKCGDPVADKQGNIHYTKRRMNLMKAEIFPQNKSVIIRNDGTVYKCPICGREKKFSLDPRTNSIREG